MEIMKASLIKRVVGEGHMLHWCVQSESTDIFPVKGLFHGATK